MDEMMANYQIAKYEKMRDDVLKLIRENAWIDGAHHKQWLIDQILRLILDDEYDEWVKDYNAEAEKEDYFEWDSGISP